MINGNLAIDNNPQFRVASIRTDDASARGQGVSRAGRLAGRMLSYESGEGQIDSEIVDIAQRVYEKLRIQLSGYVGSAGFHALITRAKGLASAEYSWLHTLQINQDGALAEL